MSKMKWNPFTKELDYTENSSFLGHPASVAAGETKLIPAGRQLVHHNVFLIAGMLIIDGELALV